MSWILGTIVAVGVAFLVFVGYIIWLLNQWEDDDEF